MEHIEGLTVHWDEVIMETNPLLLFPIYIVNVAADPATHGEECCAEDDSFRCGESYNNWPIKAQGTLLFPSLSPRGVQTKAAKSYSVQEFQESHSRFTLLREPMVTALLRIVFMPTAIQN